jgi:hypothetical protein
MGRRREPNGARSARGDASERARREESLEAIGERLRGERPRRRRDSDDPPEVAFQPTTTGGSASRSSVWRASIAVALGSVALGSAPFAYVLTQPVDFARGRTSILFGVAFLSAGAGITRLPALCFGFLAPGSEGVTTDPYTGNTHTFRHTQPRARRALRWLLVSIAVIVVCCIAMPHRP